MFPMIMLCGVLAAVLLMAGREVQRRVKRARVYGRREAVGLPAIWNQHFSGLGLDRERGEQCWLQLARTFHVEPGKLRITDRFDGELRNLDHLLDGWMLLTMTVAQSDTDLLRPQQIETVRDFVLLAATPHPLIGTLAGH